MTQNQVLDSTAATLTSMLEHAFESLFGPGVHTPVIGPLTWGDLGVSLFFVVLVLFVNVVAVSFLRHHRRRAEQQPDGGGWRQHMIHVVGKPLYVLIWIYGIYLSITPLLLRLTPSEGPHPVRHVFNQLFHLELLCGPVLALLPIHPCAGSATDGLVRQNAKQV